ncbi:MAG TPA: DinB family protein [Gemmatimonadaceae bacterium]|nr:DinB family protein [Gemmatimonadaceae bacterium]
MPASTSRSPSSQRDTARDEHRAAVQAFLAAARAIPDAAWERPLSPGKWSPAQVAEHVRLTYVVIQNELAGGSGLRIRTPWWLRLVLRWRILPRILATGKLPAGARASSEIRPGDGPFPRAQVLEALEVAADVTEASIARQWSERNAGITHHIFGRVELPRAMRFITVHTAHHTRQLEEGRGG